jgi:hypothetical protein
MSQPNDPADLNNAFVALDAEAEQAWRQVDCPRASRFWGLALGQTDWTPEERRHIDACPQCRGYEAEVRQAVQARQVAAAAALAALVTLVARQRLARLAAASQFAEKPAPAEIRLSFEADPQLTAILYREPDGSHWLGLEHTQLAPGTLLQVVLAVPQGSQPSWTRFVVLRKGFEHAVARLWVEEVFPADGPERELTVRLAPSASALLPEAAALLRDSFARARAEDPASAIPTEDVPIPAWQTWARAALREDGLSAVIRSVLEEISASVPIEPPFV